MSSLGGFGSLKPGALVTQAADKWYAREGQPGIGEGSIAEMVWVMGQTRSIPQ